MMFMRMRSLKQYFKAAEQEFKLKKFFEDDIYNILSAVTFILILVFTIKEVFIIYPKLEQFVRISFTIAGAIGDYAFAVFLSKSKKHIRDVISSKINENKNNGLGDLKKPD